MEIYHQRMAEIQDVSDVIAVANMQLNKIISKFGWTKQSLMKVDDLKTCPIDENHKIHKDNLQSHAQTCMLRKHKIMSVTDKDLPLPPSYNSDDSVVPIFVSKAQYKKLGIKIEADTSVDTTQSVKKDELLEVDEDINNYTPCNPLDELRFIYSWHRIPTKYLLLDITRIPKVQLNGWLIENISATSLSDDLKVCMINSMSCWLNELPTPSQVISYIQDLFGENSKTFVLRLWKFLAAKCLCLNQHIPEHTRNEFDFYTTTSMTNQNSVLVNKSGMERKLNIGNINPFLPIEWVYFKLTAEQKLTIYEDVCKTWRSLKDPSFRISDLQMETQEQVKMLTEFDENLKGAKTHIEVLAELRDYKRRRQSYRGKNKSTKKMSAIEVLRELFDQQMLYLKLLQENKRQQEDENRKKEKDSKTKSVSPNKCSSKERREERSSSRHRSGNRSRSSKRNRSRESKRSKSKDVSSRSRSRSRDRYHKSNRERYHERSKERKRYHDSRDRNEQGNKNEISNKTYYDVKSVEEKS